jgi:ABC-type multidrug transport system fused ATPase/permease subunit
MLKRSDRILWIEDGRIVKMARPSELNFSGGEIH